MKSIRVLTCACALALVTAVGCSNGTASSASASSASQTSATSSEQSAASETSAESTSSVGEMTAAAAKSEGYQVFSGTVHVANGKDLVKLQDRDVDPAIAEGDDGTYAVVVFDDAIDVKGQAGDGSGQVTQSSKMMGVAEVHPDYNSSEGNIDTWRSLDGQKVTIGAKAEDIWFPSDVRLPIGEPTTSAVVLIQNA